jgi:hypothetical protein
MQLVHQKQHQKQGQSKPPGQMPVLQALRLRKLLVLRGQWQRKHTTVFSLKAVAVIM